MNGIAGEKSDMRRGALARRAGANRRQSDDAANLRLLELLARQAGRVVAGYLPVRTEINPVPAMTGILDAGKPVCVPVVVRPGAPLLFREWTPDADLVDGAFGVPTPVAGRFVEPDLFVVPLVAFDRRCYRLGYGGGFYDRTLGEVRNRRNDVLAFGFAYAVQEVPAVPRDATDQRLDAVVTEAQVHVPYGKLPESG